MRRIAVINQKGGVGKTTTSANLAAALTEQGRRVTVVDMDPQANLSLHLGVELQSSEQSIYPVLLGRTTFAEAVRATNTPGLSIVPSTIDLSGAELELAATIGRERVLLDCIAVWEKAAREEAEGRAPADYLIFDCPPSLGLLSVNALSAASEVLITVQTEFMALMGMSKLVEVVEMIKSRLNPSLEITGILPCLYDSRLRLAREVLGEIRKHFPGQVFRHSVRSNVKLAEAPSFGKTILEYAPESNGALDYRRLALALLRQEERDPELKGLPEPRPLSELQAGPERGLREVVLTPPPKVAAKPAPRKTPKKAVPVAKPVVPAPAPVAAQPNSRRNDGVEAELEALGGPELPNLPPETLEVPRRRRRRR